MFSYYIYKIYFHNIFSHITILKKKNLLENESKYRVKNAFIHYYFNFYVYK